MSPALLNCAHVIAVVPTVIGAFVVITQRVSAFAVPSSMKTDALRRSPSLSASVASAAVIEALAPICVDKFQHAADADKNKVELQKANSSDQIVFIEKGGWAAMPGNSSSNNAAVAQACAKMLSTLK